MSESVSFDTETGGLRWFNKDEQAFITTWSDQRGEDHIAFNDDPRGMAAFESDMRKANALVAHNLSFDVHQLRATNGINLLTFGKPLIDTANLARVTMPERGKDGRGYKLKDLATDLLDPNAADSEDELKAVARRNKFSLREQGGYRKAWEAEPEVVETYAMKDTRLTIDLADKLPVPGELVPTWELERKLQPHLIRSEARGVSVNQDKVQELKADWEERQAVSYDNLVGVLGNGVIQPPGSDEPDDYELLRDALKREGVPLYRQTDNGQLATNRSALNEFAADFPVLQDLSEYRTTSKFLATYINPMDGRTVVHPSFWQIGAWTGRMACTSPNMQNVPVRGDGASELREMFIPRPGHCFIVSDFDQIELRFLAYYLNSPEFIERIERGDDVFAELAYYLAETQPTLGWEVGDPEDYRKGGRLEKYRSPAKNVVYAISYGAGRGKISDMLGLPGLPLLTKDDWLVQKGYMQEGKPSYQQGFEVIKTVKSWLPGYEGLTNRSRGRIPKKIERDGYVSTINGRKQILTPDKAYVGLNALIQGSAADVFKQAVINVSEAVADLGALPVLYVHDEIVTECPLEYAPECLRRQDDAMRNAWDLTPALAVSGSIAYNNYAEGK